MALRGANHRTPSRWWRRARDGAHSSASLHRRAASGCGHLDAARDPPADAQAAAGSIVSAATRARRGRGVTAPPGAPLVQSRTIGKWKVHAIQAGGQKLDGGAMFGVVPKPLWSRRIEPDERNRIQLGMRCLLIEHESGLVLIDTGAGNKENEKFHEIYGVENEGANG